MPTLRNSGARQDTWIINVHLNGNTLGVWDKKTGGELDSDEVKYYPGGMAMPQSLGGRRTTGNLTLQRLFDRVDDLSKINTILNAVGKGKVDVAQRVMDLDGNPVGRAVHWTGILKRAQVPDVDSESTTAALLEIEVSVSGFPVAQ
jgi:hypothetical protein